MPAEQHLRDGRLAEALTELQDQVRREPSASRHRVFLFQLLCVLGEWERARNQLKVIAELDAGALPLVHLYGAAITCELLRRDVFAGTRTPLVMGEPLPWVALLLQALSAAGTGADALRADALEQAAAVPGTLDGQPFEWVADADSRLGPVCEAVVDGRYYWIPLERVRSMAFSAPSDLRDMVWLPAQVVLVNGGEIAALVPVRYPGSEADPDALIRLARKTEWDEAGPGIFRGRGQRMLATDEGEHALLNIRSLELRRAEA